MSSDQAFATQLHAAGGGIITHQMGHLFFLLAMVTLIFTIRDKNLDARKGWRLIQYSAIFFILWNMDAIAAHFLDNQIAVVKMQILSVNRSYIQTTSQSTFLAWVYFILKMDHLLCVPAMLFFYLGVGNLLKSYPDEGGEPS